MCKWAVVHCGFGLMLLHVDTERIHKGPLCYFQEKVNHFFMLGASEIFQEYHFRSSSNACFLILSHKVLAYMHKILPLL